MALRIEREDLWRRLITRFLARTEADLTPRQAELLDTLYPILTQIVFPITNFDELAIDYKAVKVTFSTASGGFKNGYECPAGKKATLYAIHIGNEVGTAEYQELQLFDLSRATAIALVPPLAVPEQEIGLPGEYGLNPITMEEGDVLQVLVSTTATTGFCTVWVGEEDLY